MHRKWLVRKTNPEFVSYLSSASSITPAFAQVLINRGLKSPEDVEGFLGSSLSELDDPFGLDGMEAVVSSLEDARDKGLKVLVHGDYDCDGITATAIMVECLSEFGMDVEIFVPNRFEHGYGFNPPGLEHARRVGAGLIVTVDCGITAMETAAEAAAEGIGLIITDHHEPHMDGDDMLLPEALAVVNPKVRIRGDDAPVLSGAGVALKVAQALSMRHPGRVDGSRGYDLAALGILADSVLLLEENRIMVRKGLEQIASRGRLGIAALMDASGVNPELLRAVRVQFTLVPRLNAAGRLADATRAVELMLATSPGKAALIADELNSMNYERQRIEEQVHEEAVEDVERKGAGPAVVVAREGWHEGVVGIVASKLADRYERPCFVLSIKGDVAKGSARSVPGFDVHSGLVKCSGLLKAFGGHKQAAGLTLRAADIPAFEEAISEVAALEGREIDPALTIDASVRLGEVSFRLVEELGRLEPFGYGNPEPVLGAKGLQVIGPRVVGKGHLKMRLRHNSTYIDAIGFGMGDLLDTVEDTLAVDAAFTASVNVWEGRRSLQLSLKGLRESDAV
jgi:single-stranded-DNA-specific exonuclease